MAMQTIRDIAGANREPTQLERQAINEVLELVDRYAADMTTTAEIRAATSGKQRWLATRFTSPSDRLFQPLMAMLDALIADADQFKTKHGFFSPDDLFAANGRVIYEDGHQLLQFPYRWPWITKPDKNLGIAGVRDEPVYRQPDQRGPFTGDDTPIEFRDVAESPREWWEVDDSSDAPLFAEVTTT